MSDMRRPVINCPHCGSVNTATLSVVYESGTSLGGVEGASYGSSGMNLFGGSVSTQTALSARATPPQGKSTAAAWLVIVLAIVFSMSLMSCEHTAASAERRAEREDAQSYVGLLSLATYVFVPAAAISVVWIVVALKYNARVLPRLEANWIKSWMCLQCGQIFTPQR